MRWRTLGELTDAVRAFLDPVLAGREGRWDVATWTWRDDRGGLELERADNQGTLPSVEDR